MWWIWLFSWRSAIFWTVALCIAAYSIRTIYLTMTLPRGAPREPACEACGYSVAGLQSLECSECGADLRRVGVVSPAALVRRRGGLGGALVGWTFLVALMAATVFAYLARARVMVAFAPRTTPSVISTRLTPNSGAFSDVLVTNEYLYTGGPVPNAGKAIELVLTLADGTESVMSVDTTTQAFATAVGAAELPAPAGSFSAESVVSWFAECGMDASDESVVAEATELAQVVTTILLTPATAPQYMTLRTLVPGPSLAKQRQPMPATSAGSGLLMYFGAIAGFVVLWAFGVAMIYVRRTNLVLRCVEASGDRRG